MKKQTIKYFILLLYFIISGFSPAFANPLYPSDAPPQLSVASAVLIDAETGTVLLAHNPSQVIPLASLTKLMTIHLALRQMNAGMAHADDIVALPPETWAENQPPRSSLMFLGRNQIVTLGELLLGLAVPSGNDAAVAVALHLAPTMEAFTAMMNAEAGRLGLPSTRFVEPSGFDAENTTTAMDFARFCRIYLKEHPESPSLLHSRTSFSYPLLANTGGEPPRTIVQINRNTLLRDFPGVDGLKTGHIPAAGYNVALSASRGETRLLAVVLGAVSEAQRDRDGRALLEWGFANFKTMRTTVPFLPETRIWGGREKYAALKLSEDLVFTVSIRRAAVLNIDTEVFPRLKAPMASGELAGILTISDNLGELKVIPLVLEKGISRGNFFRVFFDAIRLFFLTHFG